MEWPKPLKRRPSKDGLELWLYMNPWKSHITLLGLHLGFLPWSWKESLTWHITIIWRIEDGR